MRVYADLCWSMQVYMGLGQSMRIYASPYGSGSMRVRSGSLGAMRVHADTCGRQVSLARLQARVDVVELFLEREGKGGLESFS